MRKRPLPSATGPNPHRRQAPSCANTSTGIDLVIAGNIAFAAHAARYLNPAASRTYQTTAATPRNLTPALYHDQLVVAAPDAYVRRVEQIPARSPHPARTDTLVPGTARPSPVGRNSDSAGAGTDLAGPAVRASPEADVTGPVFTTCWRAGNRSSTL